MKPPCPICDHTHAPNDAQTIGRFSSTVKTYRAATMPNAPRRTTRDEAEADECAWRVSRGVRP